MRPSASARTLVVGDVHGCANELKALLTTACPDRVVLVGDLFTKGPDPVGVWRLIRDHGVHVVLGNHDQRLLDVVAGRRPSDAHGHEVVERLSTEAPGCLGWLAERPLFFEVEGWTVVHAALHPTGDLTETTRRTALSLRRWPDDQPTDPRWWQVYEGSRWVVFGHDARQGLLLTHHDATGRARVVGLDTGCVYGNQLTGMWLDTGAIVSVPAARVYRPV